MDPAPISAPSATTPILPESSAAPPAPAAGTAQPANAETASSSEPTAQPPPETPPEPSDQQKLLGQFRAARRKERNLEERERRLSQRETMAAEVDRRARFLEQLGQLDEWQFLEWMAKAKGRDVNEFVRSAIERLANDGKPETVQAREALRETRQLRQELADLRQTSSQHMTAAAQDAALGQYLQEGLALLAESAESRPMLAQLDDADVAERVADVADRYVSKTGIVPELDEVLDFLEQQETQAAEAASKRLQKKTSRASPDSSRSPANGAVPETDKPERAPPLSNRAVSDRGRATPSQMSERERIAWAAEVLK